MSPQSAPHDFSVSSSLVDKRHIIVLGAGKGTRMKASRPKVLHRLGGVPLIAHVLRAAQSLKPATTTVVVGDHAEAIAQALEVSSSIRFVRQSPQLGTAHALLQAEQNLTCEEGSLVVLSGDVPRIRPKTLSRLLKAHEETGATATVLTTVLDRPFGYGRIIRQNGQFAKIVEETDATPAERAIREINSGIYVFDLKPLFRTLRQIPEAGPKKERYLPAVLSLFRRHGLKVETVGTDDPSEVRGINSQTELAEVSIMVRQTKNEELMAVGVTLEDPATTYIDKDVSVGPDTVIHPGVTLEGKTTIGARCELHSGIRIINSTIGNDVTVNNFCVITDSSIETGAQIGPFAHLRPGTVMGEGTKVGNFVELKKTTLGPSSKVNHLSYVGDATIGRSVNVGAGTITCNYDGQSKHKTAIEEHAFIGSGTQLVAPVTIGRGSYVAAGSCVTEDVPPKALAIARAHQENKTGWAEKKDRGD